MNQDETFVQDSFQNAENFLKYYTTAREKKV